MWENIEGRKDTLAPVVSTLRGGSSAPVAPAVPTPLQWRIEKFVLVGERSGGLGPAAGVYPVPSNCFRAAVSVIVGPCCPALLNCIDADVHTVVSFGK